ncbi:unnamed protein product, partial [Ectocarpus fasciculatus]
MLLDDMYGDTTTLTPRNSPSPRAKCPMPILEELVSATSQGGQLAGFTLRKIIELVASLARHDHMRIHPDGRRTNKTQRRLLETPFLERHGLTHPQYIFLLEL